MHTTVDATPNMRSNLKYCVLGYRDDILNKNHTAAKSRYKTFVYLGWKESSLTIHCFFSGTCFQVTGSARSTRALALRRPKPKRLLTISPAPFLFQPGLLAKGSNSEVQTTMCCRSLQLRSGLREEKKDKVSPFLITLKMSHADCESQMWQHCCILLFQCQSKYPSSQGGRGWRSSVSLSALIVQISTSLKASRKNVGLFIKITLNNVTSHNIASVITYNSLVGVISTAVCCS